jgi:hypothetical protein
MPAIGRAASALLASLTAMVVFAPSAFAESVRFEFGGTDTWTVPEGVTQVTIQAAGGGGGGIGDRRGGNGAFVEVDVAVTPGQTFAQVASGAGLSPAPGATFTVGVGGAGVGRGNNNGGAGGAGASIVRGIDAATLLVIAGGGGGAGRLADGGDAGQTDGSGGNGGGALAGAGGAGGVGGASGSPYANAQNFILDSSTSTGRGRGGADVGGAGSLGAETANRGGDGGAGFGGGGIGTYPSNQGNSHLSSSGGAGGSTARGSVVSVGSVSYNSAGGSGGTSGANGENGWVTITWVLRPRPVVVNGRTASVVSEPIVVNFTMPVGLSCNAPRSDRTGVWMQVPSASDCSVLPDSRSLTSAGLLGWATTPDFPVEIAQRQIDNGWGAYELFNAAGDMTAVFIPAGGWTQASSDATLFPIWAQ